MNFEKELTKPNKISSRNWLLVWLLGVVGQMCWGLENIQFSNYAHKTTGDPAVVSWMLALSACAVTIGSFISGTMGDRAGKRKKLICIGFIGWGVFTAGFGLSGVLPEEPIWFFATYLVLLDCIMSFVGAIGFSGSANAWFTDISDNTNRGTMSTVVTATVIVANIITGGLAGIIIEKFGFMTLFVGMGILVSIIGVLTIFLLNDSPSLKPSVTHKSFWAQLFSAFNFKEVFKKRQLLWSLVVLCIYTIGFTIFMTYAQIYMINYIGSPTGWLSNNMVFDYFNTGVMQGIGLIVGVLSSVFFMKPLNKGKSISVSFMAIVVSAIGLIGFALCRTLIGIQLSVIVWAIGYVTLMQASTAWYKNLCPDEKRGQIEGVRIIFYILLPMICASLLSLLVIKLFGVEMVSDGITLEVPTSLLFVFAGVWTLLTLIPLYFANKCEKKELITATK